MAVNENIKKTFQNLSITELEALAKSFKTQLIKKDWNDEIIREYSMPESSLEAFNNIVRFLGNATVKDAKDIMNNETSLSETFSGYLNKYFIDGLKQTDIVGLVTAIFSFNSDVIEYLGSNAIENIFGIDDSGANLTNENYVFQVFQKFFQDTVQKIYEAGNNYLSEFIKVESASWRVDETNTYLSIINELLKVYLTKNTLTDKNAFIKAHWIVSDLDDGIAKSEFAKKLDSLLVATDLRKLIFAYSEENQKYLNSFKVSAINYNTSDENLTFGQLFAQVDNYSINALEVINSIVNLYAISDKLKSMCADTFVKHVVWVYLLNFIQNQSFNALFNSNTNYPDKSLGNYTSMISQAYPQLLDFHINGSREASDSLIANIKKHFSSDNIEIFYQELSEPKTTGTNKEFYAGSFEIALRFKDVNTSNGIYSYRLPLVTYDRKFDSYIDTIDPSKTNYRFLGYSRKDSILLRFIRSNNTIDVSAIDKYLDVHIDQNILKPASEATVNEDGSKALKDFISTDQNSTDRSIFKSFVDYLMFESIDGSEISIDDYNAENEPERAASLINDIDKAIYEYYVGFNNFSKEYKDSEAINKQFETKYYKPLVNTLKYLISILDDERIRTIINIHAVDPNNPTKLVAQNPKMIFKPLYNFRYYIATYIHTFILKELILILPGLSSSLVSEKTMPSSREVAMVDDLSQLLFIDTVVNIDANAKDDLIRTARKYDELRGNNALETFLNKCGLSTINNIVGDSGIDASQVYRLSTCILYKEFNICLRKILLSELQEYIFVRMLKDYGVSTLFPVIQSDNRFIGNIESSYRNYVDNNPVLSFGSDLIYKYLYANAYNCRVSNQSDIIAYYYGDDIVSNGYGKRAYQMREIALFLDIYSNIRNIFYKVLLNKSFINEDEWPCYEKFFISAFAIDKFLDAKIENVHDIDFFDDNDIKNFLISYGLKELTVQKEFIGQSDLQLRIIKNFNTLVKNKGSRKVLNILNTILDDDIFDIQVKKYLILRTFSKTDTPGKFISNGYSFMELDYDTSNLVANILSNIQATEPYKSFINNDPYWLPDAVTEDDLTNRNLNLETSKYIGLTIRQNIANDHYLTRYVLSMMTILDEALQNIPKLPQEKDRIIDKDFTEDPGDVATFSAFNLIDKLNFSYSLSDSSDDSKDSVEIPLRDLITCIRFLYTCYTRVKGLHLGASTGKQDWFDWVTLGNPFALTLKKYYYNVDEGRPYYVLNPTEASVLQNDEYIQEVYIGNSATDFNYTIACDIRSHYEKFFLMYTEFDRTLALYFGEVPTTVPTSTTALKKLLNNGLVRLKSISTLVNLTDNLTGTFLYKTTVDSETYLVYNIINKSNNSENSFGQKYYFNFTKSKGIFRIDKSKGYVWENCYTRKAQDDNNILDGKLTKEELEENSSLVRAIELYYGLNPLPMRWLKKKLSAERKSNDNLVLSYVEEEGNPDFFKSTAIYKYFEDILIKDKNIFTEAIEYNGVTINPSDPTDVNVYKLIESFFLRPVQKYKMRISSDGNSEIKYDDVIPMTMTVEYDKSYGASYSDILMNVAAKGPMFAQENRTADHTLFKAISNSVSSFETLTSMMDVTSTRSVFQDTFRGLKLALTDREDLWYTYLNSIDSNFAETDMMPQINCIDGSVNIDGYIFDILVSSALDFPIKYYSGMFSTANTDVTVYRNLGTKKLADAIIDTFYTTEDDIMALKDFYVSDSEVAKFLVDDDLKEIFVFNDDIDEPAFSLGEDDESVDISVRHIQLGTAQSEFIKSTFIGKTTDSQLKTLQDSMNKISTKLIAMINTFRTILSSQEYASINLALSENEVSLKSYVSAAVSFFISYTTKLYSSKIYKVYDNKDEAPHIIDHLKVHGSKVINDGYHMGDALKVHRCEDDEDE